MTAESPDGVRIVRESSGGSLVVGAIVAVFVLAIISVTLLMQQQKPSAKQLAIEPAARGSQMADSDTAAPTLSLTTTPAPTLDSPRPASQLRLPNVSSETPAEWRTGDANDLATYFSPGDPVPTGRELIEALRASGETEGLAAFNPPGTVPLMAGIAVPPDYVLPPGYVRHHQVTDEGEPLEAILMFAPDVELRDASGNLVSIPEDRIVPPEMVPPGLPIRQISLPPSG